MKTVVSELTFKSEVDNRIYRIGDIPGFSDEVLDALFQECTAQHISLSSHIEEFELRLKAGLVSDKSIPSRIKRRYCRLFLDHINQEKSKRRHRIKTKTFVELVKGRIGSELTEELLDLASQLVESTHFKSEALP